MSRSFKKTPGFADRSPWAKNQANRRVRRSKDVPNGKAYKCFYPSWDICDWKSHCFSEAEVKYWIKEYRYKRYELFMK